MPTSTTAPNPALLHVSIQEVETTDDALRVHLSDGRTVEVPISWYPRLSRALPRHRKTWSLVGRGHGIHWPELDEDISVENILLGQPSGESAASFDRWLAWYGKRRATTKGGRRGSA